MTRLVKRLIVAVLLLGALLLPVSWAVRRAKTRVLASPVFVVPRNIRTLFVGDSHVEVGLDPHRWPCSANFAKSGENYFFTYHKLRHLLMRNPQIAKVVVGCS